MSKTNLIKGKSSVLDRKVNQYEESMKKKIHRNHV